jgi:nitrogen fixation/metabolism regulation signal transduction histidine kinase
VASRITYERRILFLALGAGLPGLFVSLGLLWLEDHSSKLRWTLSLVVILGWLACAYALRERVVRPLQTISNLLAALREGDYSIRGRGGRTQDALGEAMFEVNALGATLRDQRLGAMEASALLQTVMSEIEVAVFAFDSAQRLRLVNRAGERLLARPVEHLLGRSADELGLDECLAADAPATMEIAFPGSTARWGVRRGSFRENGLPHHLLVLTDLSRALREEERLAWQRLIRVLGHEMNNSLTPIRSIASSLAGMLDAPSREGDWDDDMRRGLAIVAARSESLGRFMQSYSRLARLPSPTLEHVDVAASVRRVAALETRTAIELSGNGALVALADRDQLEQALINLVRNAAEAALETGGGVRAGWRRDSGWIEIWVEDDGPGISSATSLFVPFFTTKQGGSGIGLVLSRQIAEAHGGTLTLENRDDGKGSVATIRLPDSA